jgi:hypothetical protein
MNSVTYLGLDCIRLANASVELMATTAVGPRILRYGFLGGENILAELAELSETTSLGLWKPYGGHRLWAAPESKPRTYAPDNEPLEVTRVDDLSVRLRSPVEAGTALRKEMIVRLAGEGSHVTVEHRIVNEGLWEIELAPWALTIVRGGGTTIIPQEPYRPHSDYLLPARPLVLWHYTDLSDPRWSIGPRFIRLRTDEALTHPQKAGVANKRGWAAYLLDDTLFVKRFEYVEGARYPDFGSNTETYTAGSFMEVETLGPLVTLAPGESTTHIERWELYSGIVVEGDDEESLEKALRNVGVEGASKSA